MIDYLAIGNAPFVRMRHVKHIVKNLKDPYFSSLAYAGPVNLDVRVPCFKIAKQNSSRKFNNLGILTINRKGDSFLICDGDCKPNYYLITLEASSYYPSRGLYDVLDLVKDFRSIPRFDFAQYTGSGGWTSDLFLALYTGLENTKTTTYPATEKEPGYDAEFGFFLDPEYSIDSCIDIAHYIP